MEWAVICLGLVLGIILVRQKRNVSPKQQKPTHQAPPPDIRPATSQPAQNDNGSLPRGTDFTIPSNWFPNPANSFSWVSLPPPRPSFLARIHTRAPNERERALVEDWKKSIIGLIKLAEQNLRIAKQYLMLASYKMSVEHATTSIENIARALIHCYGGKPDSDTGQEEALSLLHGRIEKEEMKEFEDAIHQVARVHTFTLAGKQDQEISEEQAKQTYESALAVANLFKRIMIEHFATEISELGEACPKCHSLDVETWSFKDHKAALECGNCHHKWTEDRN